MVGHRCRLARAAGCPDVAYQVSDRKRPATFMKVLPGRYRWEFRLNEGETVDDLCAPDRLSALIRPWTKDLPFSDLTIIRTAEYTFKARIADRWQDRRVFLLGDAAHLTPPFIGQGLCAAMRDASNLSWKLAAVLHGGAPESLLDTYQEERWEPARALVRKAVMLGTAMSGVRASPRCCGERCWPAYVASRGSRTRFSTPCRPHWPSAG